MAKKPREVPELCDFLLNLGSAFVLFCVIGQLLFSVLLSHLIKLKKIPPKQIIKNTLTKNKYHGYKDSHRSRQLSNSIKTPCTKVNFELLRSRL